MRLLELLFCSLESFGRLDLFTVGACTEGLNADVNANRFGLTNACCRHGFGQTVLYEDGLPEAVPATCVRQSKTVGVDVGIETFGTCSDGEKIKSPKALKRAEKKLKKAQRALSRKQKGSKNREKGRKRLAKLHRKVKRRRSDFLHKTSRRLVNENQALIFETLKIKGMMKNHHLAKEIADAGWAEFMRQCEYKAKHEGRIFAKIGTFFPSSKTCSACGHKLKELSLATRSWTCPHCGAHHDRDLRKLFKTPISERWGKQICLNE